LTARKRVAILISGRGSNMSALIEAAKAPDYPAHIVGVFSNAPDAAGLAVATENGAPTASRSHKAYASKAEFEAAMDEVLADWQPDIICLAGFMRLLSAEFCTRWAGKLINIHPSLLPLHKGLHTHEQALAAGAAEHGCTVHFVTPGMDEGPVIAQARVPVLPGDTAETLAARVLIEEHKLYPAALAMLARGEMQLATSTLGPAIRRLTEADAAAFRAIRLEALKTAPEAFGSSYDTERERSETEFAATLTRNYVAGAWLNDTLVGTAGFYSFASSKEAHRGGVWGVFVHPDHRGSGIARALVEAVVSYARDHVIQLHLSVVTTNTAAVALYTRLGFSIYGTEPRSLSVNGQFFDEHLMVKRLDG
jgi:phosphoribosylglycinamide formyltransferase-1